MAAPSSRHPARTGTSVFGAPVVAGRPGGSAMVTAEGAEGRRFRRSRGRVG